MRTTADEARGTGRRLTLVSIIAMVVGILGVLLVSGTAGAHDHGIPHTVLKKGDRGLQAGTRVMESSWNRPAGDGLCINEAVVYTTRFPETDSVAPGSKLRVRISKAQRPDTFKISAYRTVDENGMPVGEGRLLERSLKRVVSDGKTVAWSAVFSVNRPDRDYYLVSEGHWQDREGCGGDQYAFWSFHVKTLA